MEKERYPKFIHIPEFTNDIVSAAIPLKRSKTLMRYSEAMEHEPEPEVVNESKSERTASETLLKNVHNMSSAFVPITQPQQPVDVNNNNNDNCILN